MIRFVSTLTDTPYRVVSIDDQGVHVELNIDCIRPPARLIDWEEWTRREGNGTIVYRED